MRASRYRLRFSTGATLSSSVYGGGAYGDDTYGTVASDSLTTAHHRLVPWPAGALTDPSWRYRQHDTKPDWSAQIIADDGVIDYTGLFTAYLILTPANDPTAAGLIGWDVQVVTAPNGDQRLVKQWDVGDLDPPGVYRAVVVLVYNSTRRLSVPADDRHTFIITKDGS